MSTEAQIAANQQNSQSSTGPRTPEGKSNIAGNALTLGLFTLKDFVRPEEQTEYETLCKALWSDLHPSNTIEQAFATEILHATWRLRRCSIIEAGMADPELQDEARERAQLSVDRARAQANNILRRSLAEIRRLQLAAKDEPKATAPAAKSEITIQSQSAPQLTVVQPPKPIQIPRGANCPCGSRLKYKRCCGKDAPPVLHCGATNPPKVA